MATTAHSNHLSFGFNRRLVEAVEFLKTRKENRINRTEILRKIEYETASYDQVKKGRRSFPKELERKASIVLMEYGIRPDWLINGTGEMEVPKKYNERRPDDHRITSGGGESKRKIYKRAGAKSAAA